MAAPRVLFAWEQGGGLGHLARIAPVAHALLDAGAEVHAALADLARATQWLDARVVLHACPIAPGARAPRAPQDNAAALLARAGWLDAVALDGLLRAWDALLDALAPDVLVCDYAPTALLAAGSRPRLFVAAIGNGFDLPPSAQPLPAFDDTADAQRLGAVEDAVLASVNAALTRRGRPALPRLAAVYACHWRAALCHAAFDPYERRPPGDIEFLGTPAPSRAGATPPWPPGDGARVFAYLRGPARGVAATVAALRAQGCRALVCATSLDAGEAAQLTTPRIGVHVEAFAAAPALEPADVVVTHSGSGLGAQALALGKPLVLLPLYREQWMVARRLHAQGLAYCVQPDAPEELVAALTQALAPAALRNARAFAEKAPLCSDFGTPIAGRLLQSAEAHRSRNH